MISDDEIYYYKYKLPRICKTAMVVSSEDRHLAEKRLQKFMELTKGKEYLNEYYLHIKTKVKYNIIYRNNNDMWDDAYWDGYGY